MKSGTTISENQPRESAFRLVESTPNYELSEGASGISRNTTECNHSPRKKYRDWSRMFSSPGNKPTSSNYCAGGPSSSTYQWTRTSADPNCSNENFNSKDVNYWTNVFFPTTKNSRESSNIPTTSFLNQRNDLLSYRNLNESSTAAENENPILPPYNSSHNPLRRKNLTGSKPVTKSNYQTNSELFSTIDLIGGGGGNSGGDNNADNSSFLQVWFFCLSIFFLVCMNFIVFFFFVKALNNIRFDVTTSPSSQQHQSQPQHQASQENTFSLRDQTNTSSKRKERHVF